MLKNMEIETCKHELKQVLPTISCGGCLQGFYITSDNQYPSSHTRYNWEGILDLLHNQRQDADLKQ